MNYYCPICGVIEPWESCRESDQFPEVLSQIYSKLGMIGMFMHLDYTEFELQVSEDDFVNDGHGFVSHCNSLCITEGNLVRLMKHHSIRSINRLLSIYSKQYHRSIVNKINEIKEL